MIDNVAEERGEKEKRAAGCGGGGGWCGVVVFCVAFVLWCGVVWCGVVVCVCMPRNKFLSRMSTEPVLFLFVHPCKNMAGEELAHRVNTHNNNTHNTQQTHTTKHSFTMQGSFLMESLAL